MRICSEHVYRIGKNGNGFFAESKASWASLSNIESWLGEGYKKVIVSNTSHSPG